MSSTPAPGTLDLTAFGDESESVRLKDPDTYILVATLCPDPDHEDVRDTMRSLLHRGQRKVHWRETTNNRERHKIIDAVAGAGVEHVVVVRDGSPGERPERRRRHCLERLCYELDQLGVPQLLLESRGPADDKRDRHLLDTMRAKRVLPGGLRMGHAPGPSEPLLWLPDAVCGAVTQSRLGDDSYLRALRSTVELVEIVAD